MKCRMGSRFLSAILTLALIVSLVPAISGLNPEAGAASVDYATPATEEELANVQRWFSTTNGSSNTGTFAKIIDGTVYVWGSNRRGATGLTGQTVKDGSGNEYVVTRPASDTAAITDTDIITVPSAIPAEFFGNEKIVRITSSVSVFVVLTSENNIYVWGHSGGGTAQTAITGNTYNARAVNTDLVNGDIVDIKTLGICTFLKSVDDDGGEHWYSFGVGSNMLQAGGTSSSTQAQPIPETIMEKVGGSIKDIAGAWNYATYVIGGDGKLYAFTNNATNLKTYLHYSAFPENADGEQSNGTTVPVDLSDNVPCLKGLTFTGLKGEDWSIAAMDTNGDVWGFGTNSSSHFGSQYNSTIDSETGCGINETHKFFDHNVFQKKAVSFWISSYRSDVLCEDNTVYAVGDNSNGIIVVGGGSTIGTVTQIQVELSKKETIVGVFPANDSQMVITKAGDMYFAGNNSTGGAGTGTTESASPGESVEVVSDNMPPSAPLTANKVHFEIEVTENGAATCYQPTGEEDAYGKMLYNKIVAGVNKGTSTLTLDAGDTFKLNVYFEDFGKIQTFVMPIRFDPEYVKVVNGTGTAYSSSLAVVTPGSYGTSVGIEQCFDTQDWAGGYLNAGAVNGTYPKISNAGGYVSVAGYSTDSVGTISGDVKMFSIAFRAQKDSSGSETLFAFATPTNTPAIDTSISNNNGYDEAILKEQSENCTAYWSISNATGSQGKSGYFAFNYEDYAFPRFATTYTVMSSIELSMTYGANNASVTDQLGDGTDSTEPSAITRGWRINWTNKDVVYTVTATSKGSNGKPASFPQVTWSYRLYDKDGNVVEAGDDTDPVSEYIVLTGQTDTSISFKINPDFEPEKDSNGTVIEEPVYVEFIATGKYHSVSSAPNYVKLKNYAAPGTIKIAQSADNGVTRVPVGTDSFVTYNYTDTAHLGSTDKFWVYYGVDSKTGASLTAANVDNSDVVWYLRDSDGVEVDVTAATAPAVITRNSLEQVTVSPHFTIKNNDYLILHVESLYDSTVYDEIKIRIQLYATALKFDPEIVRMSITTDTMNSSINLASYLKIEPADVYATDLTWSVDPFPEGQPGNANIKEVDSQGNETGNTVNVWKDGDSVNYGSLGTGSTASIFYAYGWATPTKASTGSDSDRYVSVRVTDSYSNLSQTIKVAIMDINCPISMNQFEATNNIGTASDTVAVKSGLELNDIIRFYNSYEDAMEDTDGSAAVRTTTIVNDTMYPAFTFAVGDTKSSMMAGGGGYLYVTLTRDSDGGTVTYDPVPVAYGSEPSLVYGYVHLYGKVTGSVMDSGITVLLSGGDFKEYVTTDTNGYFKFTKYIAPGDYTMTISKQNYLTRTTAITIEATTTGKFMISSNTNPLILFPGDLTGDSIININDITYYVANWVGLTDDTIGNYTLYDFLEDGVISMADLELLLQRKDWVPGSYPTWSVPDQ